MRIESLGVFNPLCISRSIVMNRFTVPMPTGIDYKPCIRPLSFGICISDAPFTAPPIDTPIFVYAPFGVLEGCTLPEDEYSTSPVFQLNYVNTIGSSHNWAGSRACDSTGSSANTAFLYSWFTSGAVSMSVVISNDSGGPPTTWLGSELDCVGVDYQEITVNLQTISGPGPDITVPVWWYS